MLSILSDYKLSKIQTFLFLYPPHPHPLFFGEGIEADKSDDAKY